MTNFNDLSKNPIRFLSFTGFKLEEFLALLPHFTLKFKQYMEEFTVEGKIRQKRKYVEYKSACLPTIENKLLFILTYLKGNDLQERIAEMFSLTQPKANLWIHLLHSVLNQTLNEIEVLPARDAESLERTFDQLKEEATSLEMEEEASAAFEMEEVETTSFEMKEEAEATSSEMEEIEATSFEMKEAEVTSFEMEEAQATLFEMEEAEATVEMEAEVIEEEEEIEIELYLHDGTERLINRPLDMEMQKIFYSGKQKKHTLKNNLVIDISCNIFFLSKTCEGKKHDKKVADEAGYKLPEGSYLGQDTGFQGFKIPGVNIIQPKKKPRGGELTVEEKEQNRIISSVRVRVEHAIGGVKRYRIVKETLRNWKNGFKDLVMETCCGLHNFRLKFRPWHYEVAVI